MEVFMKSTSFIIVCAALAGCAGDGPTDVANVQLAIIGDASHGGAPLSTNMTQEVTTIPPYEGDRDGVGVANLTINVGQGEICWDLAVQNITLPATASHIHKQAAGVRGPIVVGLSAPGEEGTSSGCTSVDRELAKEILQNPADFYVNVHTRDYAPGAIRGQLGE
jgi:hypothetical protein